MDDYYYSQIIYEITIVGVVFVGIRNNYIIKKYNDRITIILFRNEYGIF